MTSVNISLVFLVGLTSLLWSAAIANPTPDACLSLNCGSFASCVTDENGDASCVCQKDYTGVPPNCIEKLTIDVYIGSKCSYSQDFIDEQIKPNYEQIKDDIVLTFIPFGNARSINNSEGTSFKCQFGESECELNMFQACAMHLLGDDQDLKTKLMICAMEYGAVMSDCASQVSLSESSVNECMTSGKGIELQLENERKTIAATTLMRRELTRGIGVPRVFLNGVWSGADNRRARSDLLLTVQEEMRNRRMQALIDKIPAQSY